MIVGTTIFYLDGNTYYTPQFPRGGLGAVLSVDVSNILLGGATQVDIGVETRNSEDTTWTTLTSFSAISAVGSYSLNLSLFKELVRMTVEFSGGTPEAADAVHVLFQPPSWRPYA